jgi:spore coat polysaccharide biosynthesis protein SpsF
MRTAIFVSVRNKARRLPGKTLHPIRGRSVIEHIIDRVRTAPGADLVVLTTSVHQDDVVLIEVAHRNGIEAFAGSEDDKLQRYLDAAKAHHVDFAVVVDGDDVLCDPMVLGRIIAERKANGGDFVVVDGLPLGVTGFGVDVAALARVVASKKERDTEVWGRYFVDNPAFVSRLLPAPPSWAHPEWRMTLDYPEDLAFFERIFAELYVGGEVFNFDAVVDLLTRKPEIVAINSGVQKVYEENLKKIVAEAR